jgi:hypothetical protein
LRNPLFLEPKVRLLGTDCTVRRVCWKVALVGSIGCIV